MTTSRKLKAVLFDLGGTLVASESFSLVSAGLRGAQIAYRTIRERTDDMPSSLAFYARVMSALNGFGTSSASELEVRIEDEIGKLFGSLGKKLTDDDLHAAVSAWYEPFASHNKARQGVNAVMKTLRQHGLKLGIVSNSSWPQWLIERDVKGYGLGGVFDCIVVSSEVGPRKPNPQIFQVALDGLECAAGETVFVGDSLKDDVAGGRFMGMKTIYMNVSGEPDDAALADAEIEELSELPGVIEDWL